MGFHAGSTQSTKTLPSTATQDELTLELLFDELLELLFDELDDATLDELGLLFDELGRLELITTTKEDELTELNLLVAALDLLVATEDALLLGGSSGAAEVGVDDEVVPPPAPPPHALRVNVAAKSRARLRSFMSRKSIK